MTPDTVNLSLGLQLICSKRGESINQVSKRTCVSYSVLLGVLERNTRMAAKTRQRVFSMIEAEGLLEHPLMAEVAYE